MTGIEFVDEPADRTDTASSESIPEPAGPGRAGRPGLRGRLADRRARTTLAAGLFLAAAVLAALAAPSRRFLVGFGPQGRLFSYSVDAFGTYHGAGELTREGQHAARYGIVLVACAAGLLLLAAELASPLLRLRVPPSLTRTAPYLRVGVTGLLAGVTLANYLDTAAVLQSAEMSTRVNVGAGDPVRGDLITSYGPCLWLALGAIVCASLGCVAASGSSRD